MAYGRKLTKTELAQRHLYHCENEVRKSPNNKYYKEQVAKTKKLLGV
jgi:hypothetical protein